MAVYIYNFNHMLKYTSYNIIYVHISDFSILISHYGHHYHRSGGYFLNKVIIIYVYSCSHSERRLSSPLTSSGELRLLINISEG